MTKTGNLVVKSGSKNILCEAADQLFNFSICKVGQQVHMYLISEDIVSSCVTTCTLCKKKQQLETHIDKVNLLSISVSKRCSIRYLIIYDPHVDMIHYKPGYSHTHTHAHAVYV